MNKFLFVAFALFAVINIVRCADSGEVLEKVKSKHVRQYLEKRKDTADEALAELNEICPGASEKLKDAIINFVECADAVDDSLTICQALQTATLNCTQPLVKLVDECLPQRARGLPTLGVQSFVSITDFLCKQTGESLFELLNPCLWGEDDEELDKCGEKIVKQIAQYSNSTEEVPSPAEICEVATSIRGCLKEDGAKGCKNEKTRQVALGLIDAAVAPCGSIINAVQN